MPQLNLKASHKIVAAYYRAVAESGQLSLLHEGAVAPHFAALLRACAAPLGWTLQEQYPIPRPGQHPLRADGALLDLYSLRHGLWEAKDSADDLEREARAKFRAGYPADNILFQSPTRALLFQDGGLALDADITDPERLVGVLKQFFAYEPPHYEQWEQAVAEFKDKVPELAQNLLALIEKERRENKRFVAAFDDFAEMTRQAINPNIATQAVEEMLIQHLLTERIFRRVFNNPDFAQRNVIAREIERVITALTSRTFSREAFLGRLDRFYTAIEATAATISNYREKQSFLNTVYEQFFQGFSVKVADTHGIVYTPQAIVDFMVRSVDDILRREFGKADGLAAPGVAILDPFVGTGNFILRVMRQMPRTRLPGKYAAELFCNEVMLLPYYIASMNIEHEYYELTGEYEPFEGLSLVDTFELAESRQLPLFVKENTQRVQRQKDAPIFVIIGNPPYNAKQVNENDRNKNRKYEVIDSHVRETYAKDSKSSDKTTLSDPYVKAFRWATDRLDKNGIVAFVSNSSFLEAIAFDGMRKHLGADFTAIYVLDLGGNVRKNPKLSGTTHNVFGIQVGVCITILMRKAIDTEARGQIFYSRLDEYWRREEKLSFLEGHSDYSKVSWQELLPDSKHNWFVEELQSEYESFMAMGAKSSKTSKRGDSETIFTIFSLGNDSGRDAWVYNFDRRVAVDTARRFAESYNSELDRWARGSQTGDLDDFLVRDDKQIKWTRNAKRDLTRGRQAHFSEKNIRLANYRPFAPRYIHYGAIFSKELGRLPHIFPNVEAESENLAIAIRTLGNDKPFHCLMTNRLIDLHFTGDSQCFPFYTYDEGGRDGSIANRRENITDWALARFREVYGETTDDGPQTTARAEMTDGRPRATHGSVWPSSVVGRLSSADSRPLTKWDIFHYVYALLHHPAYRETYAANLRRELPRIPFVRDFWGFARAGARLAELHVHYERQPEYPLRRVENPDERLNWRVEKMRLSRDRTQLVYNDFLTLADIPPQVYAYRLGNRSALEWVVDQYRVTTDRRSGIVNDPNRPDDPQYIVRLIGQVVTVSLETAAIVAGLPGLDGVEIGDEGDEG